MLVIFLLYFFFFFSSRRRHTRWTGDWSSDVCSSDLDHTDQHHPTRGPEPRRVVAQHVEVEGHRLGADPADVRRHAQPVVQARWEVELAMNGLARQKDVVAVEHAGVGEATGTEQLRLGDLEEPDVGPVENDAGEVHVGPPDI